MLDIHEDTGQVALHAAGLFESFLTHIEEGGEATRILDKHATVLMNEEDDGGRGRPEIERGTLRGPAPRLPSRWHRFIGDPKSRRLAPSQVIPVGTRWNSATAPPSPPTFSSARTEPGRRSDPSPPDATPAYSGISFIEADLFNASIDHPPEAEAMGGGMLFALAGDTGIMGHREPDNSLHVYLAHRADENWIDTIDFTDTPTAGRRSSNSRRLGPEPSRSHRQCRHRVDATTHPRAPCRSSLGSRPGRHPPRRRRPPDVTVCRRGSKPRHVRRRRARPRDHRAHGRRRGRARPLRDRPLPQIRSVRRGNDRKPGNDFAPDAPKGLLEMFQMIAAYGGPGQGPSAKKDS